MTREEMLKMQIKPYMIVYMRTHYGTHEMILVACDFETETFTLRVFDTENYEEEDFVVSIACVELKKKTIGDCKVYRSKKYISEPKQDQSK